MKNLVVSALIVIFMFFGQNFGDEESDLFQSNDLDCWYKPSCNLTPNSNASLIPFVAGCKCDAECFKFNDCCKDSKFFRESSEQPGIEFNCHPKLEVQMITSCPESYPNSSVAKNCSFELPIKDISFVVPVTNKRTHITYANKYCARCHNDSNYEPWDLDVDFVEITSSFFENENSEAVEFEQLLAIEDDLPASENAENLTNDTPKRIQIEDLWPNVRFLPAQESFLTTYKDKRFICTFDSKMPAEMVAFVRKCLPNLISECPDDDEKNELCQSYMEVVYDRYNSLAFRNQDCAECNSVPPEDASFCPQTEIPVDQSHGFVISGRNRTRNSKLCDNPILPRYYCPVKSN